MGGEDQDVHAVVPKRRIRNLLGKFRIPLLMLLALGFLAGGMYGAYRYGMNQAKKPAAQVTSKTQFKDKDLLIQEVGKLSGKKEYQQAIDLINNQNLIIKNTLVVQILLATVYMNKQDYKEAQKVYETAIKLHGTSAQLMEGVATAAERAKDYKTAITYYKMAKEKALADTKNPTSRMDAAYYDKKIQELQKNVSNSTN